jgi:hypothetical protein
LPRPMVKVRPQPRTSSGRSRSGTDVSAQEIQNCSFCCYVPKYVIYFVPMYCMYCVLYQCTYCVYFFCTNVHIVCILFCTYVLYVYFLPG